MNLKFTKAKRLKKTPGALLAEEMRADGNKLTDADRERLGEEFMRLDCGTELKPVHTRRR